jgi:hypothetical protein
MFARNTRQDSRTQRRRREEQERWQRQGTDFTVNGLFEPWQPSGVQALDFRGFSLLCSAQVPRTPHDRAKTLYIYTYLDMYT